MTRTKWNPETPSRNRQIMNTNAKKQLQKKTVLTPQQQLKLLQEEPTVFQKKYNIPINIDTLTAGWMPGDKKNINQFNKHADNIIYKFDYNNAPTVHPLDTSEYFRMYEKGGGGECLYRSLLASEYFNQSQQRLKYVNMDFKLLQFDTKKIGQTLYFRREFTRLASQYLYGKNPAPYTYGENTKSTESCHIDHRFRELVKCFPHNYTE